MTGWAVRMSPDVGVPAVVGGGRHRYPCHSLVWYGVYTRRWWAMVQTRDRWHLVEGVDRRDLDRSIASTQPWI